MCPFCFNTKKTKVIDSPEIIDQTLDDAIKKGQKIIEVGCPYCCDEEFINEGDVNNE
jgi:transcriptional regulator NrdR family protein